jgi:hypothetical protein
LERSAPGQNGFDHEAKVGKFLSEKNFYFSFQERRKAKKLETKKKIRNRKTLAELATRT